MGACDPNKWTCPRPGCNTTVTVTDRHTHATIAAIQRKHAQEHADTDLAAARATLPNPLRPARKRP